MMNDAKALAEIYEEYLLALDKHPKSFNSPHEGYAVLLEELDELWDEIKKKDINKAAMKEEAIQVGAMALRFLVDLSEA